MSLATSNARTRRATRGSSTLITPVVFDDTLARKPRSKEQQEERWVHWACFCCPVLLPFSASNALLRPPRALRQRLLRSPHPPTATSKANWRPNGPTSCFDPLIPTVSRVCPSSGTVWGSSTSWKEAGARGACIAGLRHPPPANPDQLSLSTSVSALTTRSLSYHQLRTSILFSRIGPSLAALRSRRPSTISWPGRTLLPAHPVFSSLPQTNQAPIASRWPANSPAVSQDDFQAHPLCPRGSSWSSIG